MRIISVTGRLAGRGTLLGIALMTAGFFLFAAADAVSKLLTDTLHPVQIVWFRFVGLSLAIMPLLVMRRRALFVSQRPRLQVLRGVCAGVSPVAFVTAVSFVPLADAVAVAFVAPFVVTVLGALVLHEPVGIRRWSAVAVGFLGAMVVIRPGLGVVHPAVILVVVAAALFAVRQIISRGLSAEATGTTIAYTGLAGLAVLSLVLPFVWETPTDARTWGLIIALAAMAAAGEILVIRALEMTAAVVLAPLQYTMLLWAALYGFLLFGDVPDALTFVGAAIIMASGLYTFYREWVVARRRTAAGA